MIKSIEFVDFDIDGFRINASIEGLSNVNLMAGMNGVGKTLMLKFLWYVEHVIQAYTVSLYYDPLTAQKEIISYITETSEYMFDTKDLNGAVKIISEEYGLFIEYKDGKTVISNLDIKKPEEFKITSIKKNTFISDTAKNWDNYERFLKKLKQYNIQSVNGITEIRLLKDDFRLYDIVYFSGIKHLLDQIMLSGNNFPLTSITDNFGDSIVTQNDFLHVKKSIPYISNGCDIKKLSKFSTGNANLISSVLFWLPNKELQEFIKRRN